MKQINIDLSEKMFPMGAMAHEFKHAHQYYEGRLVFVAGTKRGFNSQELEHEAFERGNRFSGNLQTNNNKFKVNYTYKPVFKTENYKKLPETLPSIHGGGLRQYEWIAKQRGLNIIYNKTK